MNLNSGSFNRSKPTEQGGFVTKTPHGFKGGLPLTEKQAEKKQAGYDYDYAVATGQVSEAEQQVRLDDLLGDPE